MWVAESSDLLPIVELSHSFWLVWLMHGVVTLPLALQVVAFGPDVSGFVRVLAGPFCDPLDVYALELVSVLVGVDAPSLGLPVDEVSFDAVPVGKGLHSRAIATTCVQSILSFVHSAVCVCVFASSLLLVAFVLAFEVWLLAALQV